MDMAAKAEINVEGFPKKGYATACRSRAGFMNTLRSDLTSQMAKLEDWPDS